MMYYRNPQKMKTQKIIRTGLLIALFLSFANTTLRAQQYPVILVEGFEIPYDMLTSFDPALIENMAVVTGDDAVTQYGERAAAGVIMLSLTDPAPLVVFNGEEMPGKKLSELSMGEMLSITGLNAADSMKRFGERGANGAIIIYAKMTNIESSK